MDQAGQRGRDGGDRRDEQRDVEHRVVGGADVHLLVGGAEQRRQQERADHELQPDEQSGRTARSISRRSESARAIEMITSPTRGRAEIEQRPGERFERADGPDRGEQQRDGIGAAACQVTQHDATCSASTPSRASQPRAPGAPQRQGKLRINAAGMLKHRNLSASALAELVRRGAGLLAEEAREMRRVGERQVVGDLVDRLGR